MCEKCQGIPIRKYVVTFPASRRLHRSPRLPATCPCGQYARAGSVAHHCISATTRSSLTEVRSG
ncbi:hypothetical protein WN55_06727 [Dufourea novaeangliae]|uniref:Uncharacterized protein n=1 Tax=Dufourea novaeangliae TaxID=178035 RepID=A0A154PSP0_DUFNO|nr:hypothetical protein WN55_06727 [Dufourea novaeangliae]